MNNSKSCVPYVCTGSGRKWILRDKILAPNVGHCHKLSSSNNWNFNATNNQQNSQKLLRQLEVVSSPAAEGQNNLDGYQPAAFVPSKVPRWRTPSFLNILIPEHHITPHMIMVNVMAKPNTVKIDSRRIFDIKSEKVILTLNAVFQEIVIFLF